MTLGNQNFNSTFTFNGKLHDFRYYNYALTESEIQEIISHKTLGTETLHLPLTRTDTETTFPSTLNCLPFMAKDTADYISIPYTPLLNTEKFTIMTWVYLKSGWADYAGIMGVYPHHPSVNSMGMHILLRTSNSLQLWTASSGLTANAFVTKSRK